ncbi:hypothetical protein GCM10011365_07330 [Marinicella pacifica]|uniref:Transposase IS200 family protein n=1 Tax=Marinicella pacifica TaxID=1171543 RepID=A0A917CKP0_9GAMM|nr:hypothetical protein GCM10011365_07330 [Marinicella pacifica]
MHDSAQGSGVKIHAYELMTNHIHILATAETTDGISFKLRVLTPLVYLFGIYHYLRREKK